MEKQWEQLSGIGPAVSMSYPTCLNLCRLFATICCREVSIEEPGTPPFDLTPLPIRVACPDDLQPIGRIVILAGCQPATVLCRSGYSCLNIRIVDSCNGEDEHLAAAYGKWTEH
jgi:hypothetical protein